MFGHAFAKTVGDELWKTVEESELSPRFLLSLSSNGPNVNKSIKQNINNKLQENFKRQLGRHRILPDTCGTELLSKRHWSLMVRLVENLCIDLFYFFQTVSIQERGLSCHSTETRSRWNSLSKACRVKVAVIVACSRESERAISCSAGIF